MNENATRAELAELTTLVIKALEGLCDDIRVLEMRVEKLEARNTEDKADA